VAADAARELDLGGVSGVNKDENTAVGLGKPRVGRTRGSSGTLFRD